MSTKPLLSNLCRRLLLLLIILAVTTTAYAETFEYTYKGTTLEYETINNTCKVASGQSASGDIEIPSSVSYNGSN